MRALPAWLTVAMLSATPLLMAPPGSGCPHCIKRPADALTRVMLGRNDTAVYELPIDEDGHHRIDLVLTAGQAELDVAPLSDDFDIDSLRCSREAARLSCQFVGEAGGEMAVTLRTANSTARVSIISDLTPRAGSSL